MCAGPGPHLGGLGLRPPGRAAAPTTQLSMPPEKKCPAALEELRDIFTPPTESSTQERDTNALYRTGTTAGTRRLVVSRTSENSVRVAVSSAGGSSERPDPTCLQALSRTQNASQTEVKEQILQPGGEV